MDGGEGEGVMDKTTLFVKARVCLPHVNLYCYGFLL